MLKKAQCSIPMNILEVDLYVDFLTTITEQIFLSY